MTTAAIGYLAEVFLKLWVPCRSIDGKERSARAIIAILALKQARASSTSMNTASSSSQNLSCYLAQTCWLPPEVCLASAQP
eukprot:1909745-Amphidinium_carterae.1